MPLSKKKNRAVNERKNFAENMFGMIDNDRFITK